MLLISRKGPESYFHDSGFQILSDSENFEVFNNVNKDEIKHTKGPDELLDVPAITEVFYALEVAFKFL